MRNFKMNYAEKNQAFTSGINFRLLISLLTFLVLFSVQVVAQNAVEETLAKVTQINELALNSVTDNEIEILGCQWCTPSSNCLQLNSWISGSGECDFYAKVTNLTNARITYKLCVQKLNGDWDCGMEEIGPYKTSASVYYCNVGKKPYYRIWAAYGELFNTGCDFPKP
jgi:hypothetical protein